MPTYSSYITAVQAIYDGLTASAFPAGAIPPGPFLDEAPQTSINGGRQSPPYVVMLDMGADDQWTFSGLGQTTPGQNGMYIGGFCFEAYDYSLGDCDSIIKAILWNGQKPNNRAGVAFASLSLTLPEKGIAAAVVPTRIKRNYAGYQFNNERVHVTRQWFSVRTAISGDGT